MPPRSFTCPVSRPKLHLNSVVVIEASCIPFVSLAMYTLPRPYIRSALPLYMPHCHEVWVLRIAWLNGGADVIKQLARCRTREDKAVKERRPVMRWLGSGYCPSSILLETVLCDVNVVVRCLK